MVVFRWAVAPIDFVHGRRLGSAPSDWFTRSCQHVCKAGSEKFVNEARIVV